MSLTKQDREEFRLFCEQATDAQLRNIYIKEKTARRTAYANIARTVMAERDIFTDDLIKRGPLCTAR